MTVRMITLASCFVTTPLWRLNKRRIVASVFGNVGMKPWPLVFTSGAALQLVRFAAGLIDIPQDLRGYCYAGDIVKRAAKPNAHDILNSADVILCEVGNTFEASFRGFVLNANTLKTMAEAWARDVQSTVLNATDVQGHLKGIQDILPDVPMGVVLRADGKARQVGMDAAKACGLPAYDPAPILADYGGAAIAADGLHYAESLYEPIGRDYLRFIAEVIGRKRFNRLVRPHG